MSQVNTKPTVSFDIEDITQQVVIVNYRFNSKFKIPIGVRLLSDEENNEDKPFSWWVKYDILYYYDENMNVISIDPDEAWDNDISTELKNPVDIEIEAHSVSIDEIEDDTVEIYADDDNGVRCRWTRKDGWEPVDGEPDSDAE
jgi:hypothetical protein